MNTKVTIEAIVNAPVAKAWKTWNTPEDIMVWNAAHESWHCPMSEVDLRVGGKFKSRMEARDGSFGFDFEGVYDVVEEESRIGYTMPNGRVVMTTFEDLGGQTKITTVFDAENQNPVEMQQQGWQAILDNYKAHTEK